MIKYFILIVLFSTIASILGLIFGVITARYEAKKKQ
jgi:hypothetical protein